MNPSATCIRAGCGRRNGLEFDPELLIGGAHAGSQGPPYRRPRWCLEGVRRNGAKVGLHRVDFDYHSAVRMPDGSLRCPSTASGRTLRFAGSRGRWVHRWRRSRPPGRRPSAWPTSSRVTAGTRNGGSFDWGDPFEVAALRGLDRTNMHDMTFASDLDAVIASSPAPARPGAVPAEGLRHQGIAVADDGQ